VGCGEEVEGWECFSSPEILKLKALCQRYRGAAPNRPQCPFGLAEPVFEVVPRHLCRRYDQLSLLEVRILCEQYHGCIANVTEVVKKTTIHKQQ
jgi:hypothetical protein